MKTITIAVAVLLLLPGLALAQRCDPAPGQSIRCAAWTTTVPVTFSRLEKVDGQWRIGATMSVGASYMYVVGRGTGQQGGNVQLAPDFFIGLVADFGITQGDTSGVASSLMGGIAFGFQHLAILAGYDLLRSRPVLGVGTQIQTLSITTKLTGMLKAL